MQASDNCFEILRRQSADLWDQHKVYRPLLTGQQAISPLAVENGNSQAAAPTPQDLGLHFNRLIQHFTKVVQLAASLLKEQEEKLWQNRTMESMKSLTVSDLDTDNQNPTMQRVGDGSTLLLKPPTGSDQSFLTSSSPKGPNAEKMVPPSRAEAAHGICLVVIQLLEGLQPLEVGLQEYLPSALRWVSTLPALHPNSLEACDTSISSLLMEFSPKSQKVKENEVESGKRSGRQEIFTNDINDGKIPPAEALRTAQTLHKRLQLLRDAYLLEALMCSDISTIRGENFSPGSSRLLQTKEWTKQQEVEQRRIAQGLMLIKQSVHEKDVFNLVTSTKTLILPYPAAHCAAAEGEEKANAIGELQATKKEVPIRGLQTLASPAAQALYEPAAAYAKSVYRVESRISFFAHQSSSMLPPSSSGPSSPHLERLRPLVTDLSFKYTPIRGVILEMQLCILQAHAGMYRASEKRGRKAVELLQTLYHQYRGSAQVNFKGSLEGSASQPEEVQTLSLLPIALYNLACTVDLISRDRAAQDPSSRGYPERAEARNLFFQAYRYAKQFLGKSHEIILELTRLFGIERLARWEVRFSEQVAHGGDRDSPAASVFSDSATSSAAFMHPLPPPVAMLAGTAEMISASLPRAARDRVEVVKVSYPLTKKRPHHLPAVTNGDNADPTKRTPLPLLSLDHSELQASQLTAGSSPRIGATQQAPAARGGDSSQLSQKNIPRPPGLGAKSSGEFGRFLSFNPQGRRISDISGRSGSYHTSNNISADSAIGGGANISNANLVRRGSRMTARSVVSEVLSCHRLGRPDDALSLSGPTAEYVAPNVMKEAEAQKKEEAKRRKRERRIRTFDPDELEKKAKRKMEKEERKRKREHHQQKKEYFAKQARQRTLREEMRKETNATISPKSSRRKRRSPVDNISLSGSSVLRSIGLNEEKSLEKDLTQTLFFSSKGDMRDEGAREKGLQLTHRFNAERNANPQIGADGVSSRGEDGVVGRDEEGGQGIGVDGVAGHDTAEVHGIDVDRAQHLDEDEGADGESKLVKAGGATEKSIHYGTEEDSQTLHESLVSPEWQKSSRQSSSRASGKRKKKKSKSKSAENSTSNLLSKRQENSSAMGGRTESPRESLMEGTKVDEVEFSSLSTQSLSLTSELTSSESEQDDEETVEERKDRFDLEMQIYYLCTRRKREAAACVIQRAWRCSVAKLELYNLRQHFYMNLYKLQKAAGLCIVGFMRSSFLKFRLQAKEEARRKADEQRVLCERREMRAVVVLERAFIRFLEIKRRRESLRKELNLDRDLRLSKYESAAVILQRWWRVIPPVHAYWVQRGKEVKAEREARELEERRRAAATTIQSLVRGIQTRRQVRRYRAFLIQERKDRQARLEWSTNLVRLALTEWCLRAKRLQREAAFAEHKEYEAVRCITQGWQNVLAHRRFEMALNQAREIRTAAEKIQRAYRRHYASREWRYLREISCTVEKERIDSEFREYRATITLQCFARVVLAKAAYRRRKARYGRGVLHALGVLQSVGRGCLTRQAFNQYRLDTYEAQRVAREAAAAYTQRCKDIVEGFALARRSSQLREEKACDKLFNKLLVRRIVRNELRQENAAVAIQRAFRRYMGLKRDFIRDYEEQCASSAALVAVVKIQCAWRQWKARQLFKQQFGLSVKAFRNRLIAEEIDSEEWIRKIHYFFGEHHHMRRRIVNLESDLRETLLWVENQERKKALRRESARMQGVEYREEEEEEEEPPMNVTAALEGYFLDDKAQKWTALYEEDEN